MEKALKPKYPTRELKKDIIENTDAILENRDRIKNVEACVTEFGNHIQRHGDVLDKQLMKHDIILFGEKGDDGLVRQISKLTDGLVKIESGINKVLWAVILAVVGAILKLVISP